MSGFDWLKAGPDAPALTQSDAVDRRFRSAQLSVITGLTLGYGSAYTCRLGLNVIKKDVIEQGIFNATELGTIGSAFLISYGVGKLVNGTLADQTNVKRFWALGLTISAIINLLMGGTTFVWAAVFFWAINGWFQGFLAPASAIAITNWFHPRERGTVYGIWSASHSLGEGLTFLVTAVIASALGWRFAFFGPGAYCLVVALAVFFMLKDRPQTLGFPSAINWRGKLMLGRFLGFKKGSYEKASDVDHGKKPKFASLLKNRTLWILGASSAFMYVSRYAVNSWGFLYLETERGFSRVEAGGFLVLNTVLGIAGSPVFGWVSDRFFKSRRPPVTLIFGLLEIGGLALIFFGPVGDTVSLALGWALYGFSLSGLIAVLGGLFAVDITEKRLAGAAMGFVGCFSYIGAGLQDIISGVLIDAGSVTSATGEISIDFSAPVAFWFGASIISALLAATLWRVQIRD